ncbi:transcription factor SRM1-like [Cynara cardunculus var. scolymus]|uniref:Homeodomain-like protein n=1 Tax=Cynara cardunculus var. scolymus TaxID=59895 RepID=A0A103YIE7_CYNCS|nr:transcription factor SRM1-like [Cynara cardunculus var. scolymus]KVI09607.1 Homeodomain-like protein [Cynara cardunculus var. scolymus]
MQSTWTRYEDKLFEKALVDVPVGISGWWQMIADAVPGKTVEEVRAHYEELMRDLEEIESGRIEFPYYGDDYGRDSFMSWNSELKTSQISFESGKGSKPGEGPERKKGTPWTESEHRSFLVGMEKYGRGDWRSISRHSVITRTPTQVASHAQKYFIRQKTIKKQRKRSSIHDITTANAAMQPTSSTSLVGDKGGIVPPLAPRRPPLAPPPPPPSQSVYQY